VFGGVPYNGAVDNTEPFTRLFAIDDALALIPDYERETIDRLCDERTFLLDELGMRSDELRYGEKVFED
jgi:hypothetical protein